MDWTLEELTKECLQMRVMIRLASDTNVFLSNESEGKG